jgi:hypothetical protein
MSRGSLCVEMLASPRKEVAPGTILSLTLLLENASSSAVSGIALAVPVPVGASYSEGSLFCDAVRRRETAFFADGFELPDLAPGARTAFMWKLRVEDGEEPIRIVPQIWAGQTRVVGAEPLEIARCAEILLVDL